ncbi:hypothetical protein KOR42_14770 [Thalassoglobus neptunius]|uniref:Uncharacterized protein n=1 Tax=Thalassoglobus neptunius TaxID=1938619 RepID=A0A5C5X518_9PLAN|nr:hypothetical protein KOR42_14770 [Thalassoglobus neptunius]
MQHSSPAKIGLADFLLEFRFVGQITCLEPITLAIISMDVKRSSGKDAFLAAL